MRWRNGEHGYGLVTKVLHWLTVLAIAGQFAIGLTMDADAAADRADERVDVFEEQGEERAESQGEAAEERFEEEVDRREDAADDAADGFEYVELGDVVTGAAFRDGVTGVEAHVLIGVVILLLCLGRLLWRRTTPLPPWAEHLSEGERRFETWVERVLLTLLLVVPASGLSMILGGDDDLLPLHVAAQVTLLAAIGLHVTLVLKHTLVHRHHHLSRML